MPRVKTLNLKLIERLRMMEFLIRHYGEFNRFHIADYFGMSTVQASVDISLYHELHPGNIYYDIQKRVFRPMPDFKRNY